MYFGYESNRQTHSNLIMYSQSDRSGPILSKFGLDAAAAVVVAVVVVVVVIVVAAVVVVVFVVAAAAAVVVASNFKT